MSVTKPGHLVKTFNSRLPQTASAAPPNLRMWIVSSVEESVLRSSSVYSCTVSRFGITCKSRGDGGPKSRRDRCGAGLSWLPRRQTEHGNV